MESEYFKVAVKIHPENLESSCIKIVGNSLKLYNLSDYTFDAILTNEKGNSEIFQYLSNILNQSFKGINSTVISYGQQGSGKSFSLFGDAFTQGLINLTVSYLFLPEFKEKFTYSCSMLGIFSEKLVDLLQENSGPALKIRKASDNSVLVENLAEIIVEKEEDCEYLIKRGLKVKRTHKFLCDIVFQINIEEIKPDVKGNFVSSKLNFCDLCCEARSKNFMSLNSVITCLANDVTVPYKDSNLTKFLLDTLNKTSNALFIVHLFLSDFHINHTLETLSIATLCKKIRIFPRKNETSCKKFRDLKKLHGEISKLKSALTGKKGKNLHDEVHVLKKETEKLKDILNDQSTVEEVEDLIRQNKNLRQKLQDIVGRPLADNDVELPDSVSVLQKALENTENIIKQKKIVLADQEMKKKLISEGRCTICTLKLPCKHKETYSVEETTIIKEFIKKNTFATDMNLNKFRIRDANKGNLSHNPLTQNKFVANTERKIKILSKIEEFREQKILKEIEKAEQKIKAEEEEEKKKKYEEEKRKKYLEKNKEKIKAYKMMKEKIFSQRKIEKKEKKLQRKRPQSSVKIPNYEQHKRSISDILKSQSKLFNRRHGSRPQSLSKVDSSFDTSRQ